MSRRDMDVLDSPDTIPIRIIPQPQSNREPRPAPVWAEPAEEAPRRGWTAAAVFLPALVALGLGMYRVQHAQVRQEEAAAWWAAHLAWGDLGRLLNDADVLFAPYYALLKLWVLAFGDSPTALRLPSVLAVAATAGLLVLLGRRMYDTPTGLVAGLVFAVLPATARAAQDAQPYALAALAVVASGLLLYRALDHEGADRWGGYTLSVLVAGAVHLVAAAVAVAHLLVVRFTDRQRAGAWGAVTMVPLAVLAGLTLLATGQPQYRGTSRPPLDALRDLPAELLGSDRIALVAGALALLGLILGRRLGIALAVWALLPPLAMYGLTTKIDLFQPVCFAFVLPALALLAAVGTCGIGRLLPGRPAGRPVRQALVGLVAVVAVCGVSMRAFPDLYAVPQDGRPDFRDGLAYVAGERKTGDGFVYSGDLAHTMPATAYQLRGDAPADVFTAVSPQRDGTFTGKPCTAPVVCAKDVRRVWLISTAPAAKPFAGMPAVQRTYLLGAFRPKTSRAFPGGLRITLYSR